jgi:putative oxidoreductase
MIRKILFSGHTPASTAADLGMTLLRLFAGLSLALAHGYGKLPPADRFVTGVSNLGFPAPHAFAWAAALAEFAGGLMLALGLATRWAAFFILCTMGVAAFLQHRADPYNVKEMALLYGSIAVLYLLAGAGRFSIDRLLRGGGRGAFGKPRK